MLRDTNPLDLVAYVTIAMFIFFTVIYLLVELLVFCFLSTWDNVQMYPLTSEHFLSFKLQVQDHKIKTKIELGAKSNIKL